MAETATTKTVVVADDTAFVRDRFKAALEGAGHKAVTVRTTAELLGQIRAAAATIDLLIVDLRLPHAGGVDLIRTIRKVDAGRFPVLVFSGTIGSAAEVRELAGLGVAGYINEYSAAQNIVPALAPHLFPHSFNRRLGPRVALGIPVSYKYGNTLVAAVTLNLSRGGLAIRTTNPLDAPTTARVRFRLPGTRTDVEADARVAWSDRRVGMGLQFEKVGPSEQAAIEQFVEHHFFTNRKA
jgi:two-component system chemotaxis response regulator CheY